MNLASSSPSRPARRRRATALAVAVPLTLVPLTACSTEDVAPEGSVQHDVLGDAEDQLGSMADGAGDLLDRLASIPAELLDVIDDVRQQLSDAEVLPASGSTV
ncbi:hypothetical protein [Paraoerskovia sediminicola]|uniref:hypothetical protein n=1 Tax=Paraoerskovia sediminicola TaxID=1138587 RepID=UPI0025743CE0|nr:hypothetical protein [Paraoerskovia sediminicola]